MSPLFLPWSCSMYFGKQSLRKQNFVREEPKDRKTGEGVVRDKVRSSKVLERKKPSMERSSKTERKVK